MTKPIAPCRTFAFIVISYLAIASQAGWSANSRTTEIWQALRAGHFTGVLNHDVTVKSVGTISVGKIKYALDYYNWEETEAEAVGVPHASHRLLIFEKHNQGIRYLGSYSLEDPPLRVKDNRVLFDYPADWGNTITIDKNGPPPSVLVGGRYHEFGK